MFYKILPKLKDYNSIMTAEKNAGLYAAVNGGYVIDTNSGATNAPAGLYWTGSTTLWDSTTRYGYVCLPSAVVKGELHSSTNDLTVYSSCFTVPSTGNTYPAGARTGIANTSTSYSYSTYTQATYPNGPYSMKQSDFIFDTEEAGAGTASAVKFRISVYDIQFGPASFNKSWVSDADRSGSNLQLYPCGGSYHGQLVMKFTPISTSKYHYHHYGTGNDKDYAYSNPHVYHFAGYATNTGSGKAKAYNYATNTTHCKNFTYYTVTTGADAIHYRPRINVKI